MTDQNFVISQGDLISVTVSDPVPVGVVGFLGPAGAPATVSVGSVSTGNAGSSASVVNVGTASAAVLNFTIPRGDTGPAGSGTSTDSLNEGSTNLYFTAARAAAAAPVQSVAGKTGTVALAKADVGLGNVDNTADANKSVLSATKLATARTINGVSFDGSANITVTDSTKEATANKNQVNGYAGLDGAGLVPSSLLPSYVDDVLEFVNLAGFPATGETGKIYVDKAVGKIYRWSGSVYVEISPSPGSTDSVTEGSTNLYFTAARAAAAAPVQLVAGRTGAVSLTSTDVGLANVDNTSDATKNAAAVALTNKTAVTSTGAVTGSTLVSTVATGTAPLTVTSTTNVPNLNASTVTGLPPGYGAQTSSLAVRDSSANITARGFIASPVSTATAGGTTTLSVGSGSVFEFTGTQTQTVVLPTTSVVTGQKYTIINNSTGLLTVQSSSLATVITLPAGYYCDFTALTNTPTTAAHWRALSYSTSGSVPSSANSLAIFTQSTTNTIGVGNIELGHASDTTLSRSAAGVLAVEGVPVVTTTGTQTLTNKTLTSPSITTPTGITKTDVGLGSVDNTADTAKAVLSATKLATARTINGVSFDGTANITVADSTKEATANKNQANGYAGLDATGLIPAGLLPSYVDDVLEYTNLAGFPATGETGKIFVDKATGKIYRWSGTVYVEISPSPGSTDSVTEGATNLYFTAARASAAAPVQSVAGKTGAVSLVKGDVGLGSVDNTADAAKSVLSASKLTTPVTINGVSFDGSAAITVADSTKEPAITAGTTSQYWRGDKSFQTLDKTAVGLSNVDNTSDVNKPVSTATSTALAGKEPTVTAGTTAQYYRGDKTFQTLNSDVVPEGSTNLYYTSARASAAAPVQSVAGKTGAVTLAKADVGLGSVDNTADSAKAVLSATKLATARNINGISFDGTADIVVSKPRVGTTASSATPSIDCGLYDQYTITTLAAAITGVTITGTPTDGQKLMVRIKDNGTARAITWGASFVSSGVATLLATTVASKTHMVGLIYDSAAAKWVCVAVDATGY